VVEKISRAAVKRGADLMEPQTLGTRVDARTRTMGADSR
jgi:hypothetical protein